MYFPPAQAEAQAEPQAEVLPIIDRRAQVSGWISDKLEDQHRLCDLWSTLEICSLRKFYKITCTLSKGIIHKQKFKK